MGSVHVLVDKPHGTLTVAAILLDGVGRQLDGVLAGIFLGKHQLLHLTLCVQDSHLQDCGSRGRKDTLPVSIPRQGSCYPMNLQRNHRPGIGKPTPLQFGVGSGVATVLTHILLGS